MEEKKQKPRRQNFSKSQEKQVFPIVGIGASAGGLEAIRKLLENTPPKTGLAFIIVQHLLPNQESMLPEILARSTKMKVIKVKNEMQIVPNTVFVIPSGKIMTVSDGHLKLQPKGASLKPIDAFMQSLATKQKTRAIGVLLSGTGTDGTEGLKAIKDEGGITMAQDPKSAQYADMPKSAIAAEAVYYILSPKKIAEELTRIAKHPEIIHKVRQIPKPQEEKAEDDKQTIFTLLKASFGINFANYKKSTIDRRISRRVILNKFETTKEYADYLRSHKEELQILFDDLLIGVTRFFREPQTFLILKGKVFPAIIKKRQSNQAIRVWIPGCSTGEEAYSIAIAIEEYIEEKNLVHVPVQIFGTDASEKNIEKARRAIYFKENVENNLSQTQQSKFFSKNNGNYQIVKPIRDMCIFARHDLTSDPPFSNLDLIVCRNLLIYFDSPLQERAIQIFSYALKSDRYLVLGESESIGKFTNLLEPVTKKGIVFRKKMSQPKIELPLQQLPSFSKGQPLRLPEKADYLTKLKEEVDQELIAEYVPATLIVNSSDEIVVFRGKVGSYLSFESGIPSFSLTKMLRKELRPIVQTALFRAKKTKKEIRETVRFESQAQQKTVNMKIKPFESFKNEELFFRIVFQEEKEKTPEETKNIGKSDRVKDQQIKELIEDLESTKQTLRTIIEQYEATNEELRSANEEVQSSNEELMSANEELETAKEELQSTNEELSTLNDELKNRNENLSIVNDDLSNLMDNVDTAVIIVDKEYKIRRFTASAQQLLKLIPADLGHSILDLRTNIPNGLLRDALFRVTSKLEPIREEIKSKDGWLQLRIRPYLSQEKKISGAVLSLADITEMKKMENFKKMRSDELEALVNKQAEEIVKSESLVAIGKTAGMVGHDIRNPLQSIVSELFLAKKELENYPSEDLKGNLYDSIKLIEEQIFYINKIVSDLQDFAQIKQPQITNVNVEKVVNDALSSIPAPKGIQISASIEKSLPPLQIDASYLTRIITNLVSNAIQAMPNEEGKITINAYQQNGKALITVSDTGDGMSDEIKAQVFTPLFTTKAKGQGFGTAVIKKLTESMGGNVSFESEKNKGAKFTVEFPISP